MSRERGLNLERFFSAFFAAVSIDIHIVRVIQADTLLLTSAKELAQTASLLAATLE